MQLFWIDPCTVLAVPIDSPPRNSHLSLKRIPRHNPRESAKRPHHYPTAAPRPQEPEQSPEQLSLPTQPLHVLPKVRAAASAGREKIEQYHQVRLAFFMMSVYRGSSTSRAAIAAAAGSGSGTAAEQEVGEVRRERGVGRGRKGEGAVANHVAAEAHGSVVNGENKTRI